MTSITFAFKVAPTTTDAPAPAIGRPTEQTGDKPMRTHALAVSRSPAHALTSRPAPQALTPRLLALAVAAACAAPLGALAQQAAASPKPAETSPEVKELEAVVVTGTARREGVRKLEAGFSITTATEEQIKQAAPTSTADILKTVPGVFVETPAARPRQHPRARLPHAG
jgi:hypothetical protein